MLHCSPGCTPTIPEDPHLSDGDLEVLPSKGTPKSLPRLLAGMLGCHPRDLKETKMLTSDPWCSHKHSQPIAAGMSILYSTALGKPVCEAPILVASTLFQQQNGSVLWLSPEGLPHEEDAQCFRE